VSLDHIRVQKRGQTAKDAPSRVNNLSPNIRLILAHSGSYSPAIDHVVVLLWTEELVVALHDTLEAIAEEVHALRASPDPKGY